MDYREFLEQKTQLGGYYGFDPIELNPYLKPFQRDLVTWSLQKGRSAIFASPGLGKGQPLDSHVLTPKGWLPICDLSVGSCVIASDGKPYSVTGVYPKPKQPTYRVSFSDRTSFVVDEDHLHICRTYTDRKSGKPWRVKSTKELLSSKIRRENDNMRRVYDIPVVSDVEFEKKELPLDPYLIGILLGDGFLKHQVHITIPDDEILMRVRNSLPDMIRLEHIDRYDYRIVTGLNGSRKHPFRQTLEDIGMLGKLSYEKYIPNDYLFADVESRLSLLRGLMDADGYIAKCGTCQFYSSSEKLRDGVVHLVRSLGGIPTTSSKKGMLNGVEKRRCYITTFSLKTHNPFYLKRKADRWNPNPRDNGRWIDAITYEKDQETICISVDSPDHSYVTENFTVTHNTICELSWAENVARKTNKPVLIVAPLAVTYQTVREAEKFGIECHLSRDGKIYSPITVTNYEKLDLFNPLDWAGLAGDECFVGDTPVDTENGMRPIEEIKEGDRVFSAYGMDIVRAKKEKIVRESLILTSIQGRRMISSQDHPFLTSRGWVKAKDLRRGDDVISTYEAMRILRQDTNREKRKVVQPKMLPTEETPGESNPQNMRMVSSSNASSKDRNEESFLRSILLSEMANEATSIYSECPQPRSGEEERRVYIQMAQVWEAECNSPNRASQESESKLRSSYQREDIEKAERDRSQAAVPRREWQSNASSTENDAGKIESRNAKLEGGAFCVSWKKNARVSHLLQGRYCQFREENSHRDRWIQSYSRNQKSPRQEERAEITRARVDSVEILEQDDTRLDRYRNGSGEVVLYDLEMTHHPSFSVYGLLVHNCGILKSFNGAIRNKIVEFMRKMQYRLLCSATPSPNDYPELGNCSEALGELGMVDMLNRFYKSNDNTSKVVNKPGRSDKKKVWEGKQWRFKGHAEMPFWQWVCSWAMAVRMPSDLGYPDDDFILPPLIEREHIVKTVNLADGMLMPMPAVGLDEQRKERRRTIPERCDEIVKLTSDDSRQSLVWCHLNDEGDRLEKIIHGCVQVSGRDDDDTKEGKFRDFIDGGIRVLVTKPKIGAWGLNFQHCAHIATFTDHSHEARYQGIHRCHRYGQKHPVVVDTVCTEGDLNVLENVKRKAIAQAHMFENLIACMHEARGIKVDSYNEDKVEIPSWL